MNFDQNFLKSLTILYAEDDQYARDSLTSILLKIFKKVYVASDGQEGLEYFEKFQDTIDIVISDINMPHLSGMEMLEGIREIDKKIPFIFTTAHQEQEYLLGAIKFGVYHYANKPVHIKDIIYKVQEACQVQYQQKLAEHNYKEAQAYLNVINQTAIVSKTDLLGNIIYVNDMFCDISGYVEDELIGQNHNIISHSDSASEIFHELWETIKDGKKWSGKLKNKSKDGEPYFVSANIFPMYNEFNNDIASYMAIEFLTTDEENEKRGYKSHIRQTLVEQKQIEMNLKNEIKLLKKNLGDAQYLDIIKETSSKTSVQNKKLLKQMKFYEEKIRVYEQEKIDIKETAKENYFSVMERNKELKHHNNVHDNRVDQQDMIIQKQSDDIGELTQQLNTQAGIIIDLKDVISHRESQLKKYQAENF